VVSGHDDFYLGFVCSSISPWFVVGCAQFHVLSFFLCLFCFDVIFYCYVLWLCFRKGVMLLYLDEWWWGGGMNGATLDIFLLE
jgi:hypothetical protein